MQMPRVSLQASGSSFGYSSSREQILRSSVVHAIKYFNTQVTTLEDDRQISTFVFIFLQVGFLLMEVATRRIPSLLDSRETSGHQIKSVDPFVLILVGKTMKAVSFVEPSKR